MPKFKADVVVCRRYTVEGEFDDLDDFQGFLDETGPDADGWVEDTVDQETWNLEEVEPR